MDILTATQIAATPEWHARVRHALIREAITRLGGSPDGADTLLAQRILDDREPLGPWTSAVIGDPGIMAGAHTVPGATFTDSQVTTVVTALWAPFKV